jgi:hypothetical protein
MKKILVAFAALAAFGAAEVTVAQSLKDDTELLISQIQTDKRAVVLTAMQMPDAQVQAFTPIYDEYQREMKDVMTRGSDVVNKFAANYGSMTDDAAKSIMKDFFKVRNDRNALVEKYAKKFQKVLPASKVLQWVQIENKVNTLLDVQAASVIPLSR